MTLNFPAPAVPGQIYAPPGGPVYRFDDPVWTAVAAPGGTVVNAFVTPQMYGAKGDGVTDDTAALQATAASGFDIYVPAGRYLVTDMVTIQSGRMWQGAGRTRSVIYVPNTFNLSASGVIRLGTAEPGASLFDIGIEFQQNTTVTTRAACVHYPPAIVATVPRIQIDRVRISSAWDGIDASGNFGGGWIGRIEVGALNRGLLLDGALDFVHGESWHFWCFGFSGTALYNSVYADGTTKACQIGRVDSLAVDKISSFKGIVEFIVGVVSIGPHNIGILQLDTNGARLIHNGNDTIIGECYSTKGGGTDTTPDISVVTGRVFIGFLHRVGDSNADAITVSGGSLQVGGGYLNQPHAGRRAALVSAGRLELRDITMALPAGALTAPYIEQTGGTLWVKNCNAVAGPTGSLVTIGADSADHDIADNTFGTCGLTLPAAANLGRYGPNRLAKLTFTPTLTFAVPGDLAYTATIATGHYYWESNGYRFNLRLQINGAITYTTASGSLRIGGLPAVNNGMDSLAVNVSRWTKINLDAGYTAVGGFISAAANSIGIVQLGDNLALVSVSTTQVASGTTGFEVIMSGFIPTQ